MSSSKRLNTSDATRRRLRKALEEPARNAPAGEDAAARPSSGKEIDLPAADKDEDDDEDEDMDDDEADEQEF